MKAILTIQIAQGVFLSGNVNLISSLGEEWVWRGYMMPRLMNTVKQLPALITALYIVKENTDETSKTGEE